MVRDRFRIVIACLVAALALPAWAGAPVPLEDALAKIRKNEGDQLQRIQNAQWSMKAYMGKIPEKGDLDALIPEAKNPKEYSKINVIYEPKSGRYRVDQEGVTKWIDGAAEHYAFVERFSFDGKEERTQHRGQGGAILPQEGGVPPKGLIRLRKGLGFLEENSHTWGTGYFPPNHFGKPLSGLIEEKLEQKEKCVVESSDGLWIITTSPTQAVLAKDSDFRIGYDPAKGIVLWAEWVGKADLKTKWANTAWKKHLVRWKQDPEGIWLPERFTQCNMIDRTGTRFEFTDMVVNQKIDPAVYQVRFLVGTRVQNEIEKKHYIQPIEGKN